MGKRYLLFVLLVRYPIMAQGVNLGCLFSEATIFSPLPTTALRVSDNSYTRFCREEMGQRQQVVISAWTARAKQRKLDALISTWEQNAEVPLK